MLDEVCSAIEAELRDRPEFAHTSHLRVIVDGEVVHDAHYHGPTVADVFSVTKSVVASLAGIAVRNGHLRDLDLPLEGPPPTDQLPPDWRPARDLVTSLLVPVLLNLA